MLRIHLTIFISACWSAMVPPHFPFWRSRSHFHATYYFTHSCCTISLSVTINDISLLLCNGTNCLNLLHHHLRLHSVVSMSPKWQNLSTNSTFALTPMSTLVHSVPVTGFIQLLLANVFITLYLLPFIPLHFLCTHFWQLVHCIEFNASTTDTSWPYYSLLHYLLPFLSNHNLGFIQASTKLKYLIDSRIAMFHQCLDLVCT